MEDYTLYEMYATVDLLIGMTNLEVKKDKSVFVLRGWNKALTVSVSKERTSIFFPHEKK